MAFGSLDGKFICHHNSLCDVVADVVVADKLLNAGTLQRAVNIRIDTRKHHMYAFFLRRTDENFQVVDGCRVDKRHFAHTQDTHTRLVTDGTHHVVKLSSHAEEERAVDFVHLNATLEVKYLMRSDFRTFCYVDLLAEVMNLRILHNAAQEEQDGKQQAHLDSDCEVENNSQRPISAI